MTVLMFSSGLGAILIKKLPNVEKPESIWLCSATARTAGQEWGGKTLYLFGRYRGLDEIRDSLWYLDKDLSPPNNDN